jgi:multidrug efflux pump
MDFSRFFIDRPIFAAVLSILIFITGLIAIPLLPVSEYPDVVPPSVQVRAEYPGANPKVIAETVATPLEEAINGVENMMYMKSVAGSDGVLVTTVTFRPGTDPDQAQVQVQNRVAQAEARLPEDVRRLGITTQKQSPTLTLVVHLFSPNGKYDSLYMRNYATLKVKDELARLPGVGQIQILAPANTRCASGWIPIRWRRAVDRLGCGDGDAGAKRPGVRRAAWRRAAAERERFPDLH